MITVSTDFGDAIASKRIFPIFLAAIEFSSGTGYFWTGIGSISWGGQTWVGMGDLVGVSAIQQDNAVQANNITLSVNGIPSDLISKALTECRQNFAVSVYFGLLDDTGALIADPIRRFSGQMDVPTVQDGGDTCTISLTAENLLIALQRASNRRYTHADQTIDFSTDLGFNYVPSIQEWSGVWGKAGPGGLGANKSGTKPILSSSAAKGPQRLFGL